MERGLPGAPGRCRAGDGRCALGQSIIVRSWELHENQLMDVQGFGVSARGTAEARRIEPTGIVCFRQADVGEYLREVSRRGENWVECAAS